MTCEVSKNDFDYCEYARKNETLLFRLKKPAPFDPAKKYPALVFFHGAGERGSDNEAQLLHLHDIAYLKKRDLPFFLFAPQCPLDQQWVAGDWTRGENEFREEPTAPMKLTIDWLNESSFQHNLDANRLYVLGLSMGGFAVWDIISRMPNTFSAAVPICGGGDEKKAKDIGPVPVWAFHGLADHVVNVRRSRNMVSALRENGHEVRYTEIDNAGHDVWKIALHDRRLFRWILRQSKK
jgi:predicted peptidase